jgi:hypothetical protein
VFSMQTLYCKLLHQEMVPRMFLSKIVLEPPILNPKYMPWTLNQQICNRKIEIPTKKDQEKWLNLGTLPYYWNGKTLFNFFGQT